jgi:hypothetical protein
MSRADRITPTQKQTEYYSDFLMNLDRNPISGELARVTNERAIIRSLKNLILTNKGERFFNSTIGCGLKRLLFEPMDDVTTDLIKSSIQTTIEQNEPRVILIQVDAQAREDQDAYVIFITFALVNAPSEQFKFSTVLKRVR